ncbi:Basic secretory protease [Spatholobus suberectus]|nr:Basic secretory protease [Spatholobus suberectus]
MIMHAFCFLLFLSTLHETQAVKFTVTNNALKTPGGVAFRDKIGAAYAKRVVVEANRFILRVVFQQYNDDDRKNVRKGDAKTALAGVLYHEMTHVRQWDGNGQAPGGLIEGIADFVRLKANYAPSHWVKPGQGQKWDQGYDVTAHFLDYCDSLKNGFVAQLNKLMRTGYSNQFFVQLLGKPVDKLWREYKAKYGNIP